jgi:hypothetical protein
MTPSGEMPNRKLLILFAHPALEKSRVNRVLAELADPGEGRDAGWDTDSLRSEFGGVSRE